MSNFKKIFVVITILIFGVQTALAYVWDILYIRYPHSPVLTTTVDSQALVTAMLQRWFVVLDMWQDWDYTKVRLTDGKIGFILTNYVENISESNYIVSETSGVVVRDLTFYKSANFNLWTIWTLRAGTRFTIYHINSINTSFYRIRVSDGAHSGKIGYIEKGGSNVTLDNQFHFTSDIEEFIKRYWWVNLFNSADEEELDLNSAAETNNSWNGSTNNVNNNNNTNNNANNNNSNQNAGNSNWNLSAEEDEFLRALQQIISWFVGSGTNNNTNTSNNNNASNQNTSNSNWNGFVEEDEFLRALQQILNWLP